MRKKVVVAVILFVILGSLAAIFSGKSEWPFHAIDMFAYSQVKVKFDFVFVQEDHTEAPLFTVLNPPFGRWRSRFFVYRMWELMETDRQRVVRILEFIQKRRPEIRQIRVYKITSPEGARERILAFPNL